MRDNYRELTAEELRALRLYATEAGRNWKRELLDDWQAARLTGALQALRNSHGPSWLMRYRLTREND
jgi:hypothetical protein